MVSARKVLVSLGALFAAGLAPLASAEWGNLDMPVGVTELSRQIHGLHTLILWVCIAIAVAVFGVMIYSIVKFRKSQGAVPDTTMTHSTRVEIVWTIVPVLILVAMAVPAARTLMNIEDSRNVELNVKVTGYQWKWQYEYLDDDISFFFVARSRQRCRAATAVRHRSEHRAGLPAERRQSARHAGRHQGAFAAHRAGRDPRLVGAGLSA